MSAEALLIVKEFIWAPLIGLIGWGWHHVNKRIDDSDAKISQSYSKMERCEADMRIHADDRHSQSMAYIDKRYFEVDTEMGRQRDVSAKIFDKLENMQKRGEDRHLELLHALHEGLSKKADK